MDETKIDTNERSVQSLFCKSVARLRTYDQLLDCWMLLLFFFICKNKRTCLSVYVDVYFV